MKRLLALSTKIEAIGQSQYKKNVDERLEQRSIPISNTIPKNKVSLFMKVSQTKHQNSPRNKIFEE